MKYAKLLALLFTAAALPMLTACSSDDDNNDGGDKPETPKVVNNNKNNAAQQPELARLEFPRVKTGSIVIVHNATLNSRTNEMGVNYCVEWDPQKMAQRWTCYQMYESIKDGNTTRYNPGTNTTLTPGSQYPNDEFLSSTYHFTVDPYRGSGYDHGHICPSADRLCSYEANRQTFYLTNMQPQTNGFNAGTWENMESQVRKWNRNDFRDTLYVCKGGTIDNDAHIAAHIGSGKNRIPVPKYFFMAILCKNAQGYKAMAFWIEHKAGSEDGQALKQYVISIDQLEQHTGIDFFCNLPDDIEEKAESSVAANAWGFK